MLDLTNRNYFRFSFSVPGSWAQGMTTVTLADLSHTGMGVPANNNPLAVGYIAAYARTQLGREIDPHLFKYPAALSAFLARQQPTIACFTNYMWNERLSCGFAGRIKAHRPRTVVVMGGPNYPVDPDEQAGYLAAHPEIDFFVDGEGEQAFVALFEALREHDFDAGSLRRSGVRVPGVHYMVEGEFVGGPPAPRIVDLDRLLPSPYTMGLLDEFFDDRLTPMVQTSRGCPYACTFCHDGIGYMNKTRAFSADRVREELAYIEARVRTPTLQLADLNWGLFPGDLETAHAIALARRRSGWPRNVMVATAKDQKERIVEMARVLGDALQVGAAVQSTDPEVLAHIKRTNISLDAIVRMAKGASGTKTGSFTEIILGLPGDTKTKHIKSVVDMLDAGIEDVRLFQFILLPGTEGSAPDSRARFRYETGHRALARCFGRYDVYGEDLSVSEVQEVCLGTSTMSREDYVACRAFDLTVAVFNNGGVLKEFFRLAETFGVRRSTVVERIHRLVTSAAGPLQPLYDELRLSEARNFFDRRDELEAFLARPGTIDAYLRGEYGVNHIYKARTTALFTRFETMATIAADAVRAELEERGLLDATLDCYLSELVQVAVARKSDLTNVSRVAEMTLHFDFPALQRADYRADPREVFVPEGLRVIARHTEAQQTDLGKYFAQYGMAPEGLGQFLQRNDSHVSAMLYRALEYVGPFDAMDAAIATSRPVPTAPAVPGDAARVRWATLVNE
jgi:radical SAM superfamily enzyme YgiQ (UPF0313 family)